MHTHSYATIEYTVNFFHNGDYSGDVDIIIPKSDKHDGGAITIPFNAVKSFVADYVRSQKISELERMLSSDELLGIGKVP